MDTKTNKISYAQYNLARCIQKSIKVQGPTDMLTLALQNRSSVEMIDYLLNVLPDIFVEDDDRNLIIKNDLTSGESVLPPPVLYAPVKLNETSADDGLLFITESSCFGYSVSMPFTYSREAYRLVNAFQMFADGCRFFSNGAKLYCTKGIPSVYTKELRWDIGTTASMIAAQLVPKPLEPKLYWSQNFSTFLTLPEKKILVHTYIFSIKQEVFLNMAKVILQTELQNNLERYVIETSLYNDDAFSHLEKWRMESAFSNLQENILQHIYQLEQLAYNQEIFHRTFQNSGTKLSF